MVSILCPTQRLQCWSVVKKTPPHGKPNRHRKSKSPNLCWSDPQTEPATRKRILFKKTSIRAAHARFQLNIALNSATDHVIIVNSRPHAGLYPRPRATKFRHFSHDTFRYSGCVAMPTWRREAGWTPRIASSTQNCRRRNLDDDQLEVGYVTWTLAERDN